MVQDKHGPKTATMAPDAPKKIQLARIVHVYYQYEASNVDAARQFMQDFGFFETKRVGPRTYFRGYGVDPFVLCVEASTETKFGGAAFAVDTLEELERASKILPKEARATDVYELKDAPGGGKAVTFYDPVDGFPFHLVWGQEKAEPLGLGLPEVKPNFVRSGQCEFNWFSGGALTGRRSPRNKIET